MQIKMGEKIKELRKRDRRKQEELASALGVTAQAVSRWESNGGYPDTEMLPAIANYFHITIDELFGYDNDRQTKLRSYMEKAVQMEKRKEYEQLAEFLREAVSEFPSEWQLRFSLANALFNIGREKYGSNVTEGQNYFGFDEEKNARNEYWKEAVSLLEGVLKNDIDDNFCTAGIQTLIFHYSLMGDYENAERTALSQPPLSICREVLLTMAAEEEKGDEYRGEAILALLHRLNSVIGSSVMAKRSLAYSRSGLDKLLAMAGVYKSVIDDGNYGKFHNDLCLLYLRCSMVAARLNDTEASLEYFETALGHFTEFKSEREGFRFTAPLIGGAKNVETSIADLNREIFESYLGFFSEEQAEEIRKNPKYSSVFA